jgi:hypothetical protein
MGSFLLQIGDGNISMLTRDDWFVNLWPDMVENILKPCYVDDALICEDVSRSLHGLLV